TATTAAAVLSTDLNTLKVTGLSFGGASGFDGCTPSPGIVPCFIFSGSSGLDVGSSAQADMQALVWEVAFNSGATLGCPQGQGSLFCVEAAHWTAVSGSVPEPATLGLLGLGLAGVGFARRRLKH